jgi:hypothetical protein
VCGSAEVGSRSAAKPDRSIADRSIVQKLQGEEGFHLFFESPLKRKRAARGTQTNSGVPDRRLLDERADDTAVSQYLYRCIMHDHAPRVAARGGRAAMHA